MNKITVIIEEKDANKRIDRVLSDLYEIRSSDITRSSIQRVIKDGFLLKNNEVFQDSSYKVKVGEEFTLNLPDIKPKPLKPVSIPLNIVYEDDDLIVINKQAGLTTHPGAGNDDNTLVNALINLYGNNLSKIGGDFRPGIVHRLDKDTSGLMVIAKNDDSHVKLSEQLKNRELKRVYKGFLWGTLRPASGKIENYMERSKTNRLKMAVAEANCGRYSLTHYKTLATFAERSISLCEFSLDTGRTHQIRLHCSYMGCPIVGDSVYGGNSRHFKKNYVQKTLVDTFPRQALHSYKISFYQPISGKKLNFETPLPNDMQKLLTALEPVKDKVKFVI